MSEQSQTIILVAAWPGDRAAGLFSGTETIRITLEHGGWDKEFINGLAKALCQPLSEYFDEGTCVLTESEYDAACKAEEPPAEDQP